MSGRQGSVLRALTERFDLFDVLEACMEFWPIVPILAGGYLLRFIFTRSGGGAS